MLPFKLIYSDDYYLPIGAHVFPAEKYRMIQRRLLADNVAEPQDFVAPSPASDEDILLVHTPEYVNKLKTGTLTPYEEMQLEVPYSPELVKAFWLAAGGSTLACSLALQDGVAVNIGGGFHHAFPDHGEGFCVINDVAVGIKRMHRDGKLRRAMTLDCDVHDGNGTAAIFPPKSRAGQPLPSSAGIQHDLRGVHAQLRDSSAGELPPQNAQKRCMFGDPGELPPQNAQKRRMFGDPGELEVFTISLHQANNYPAYKPPSSIDVNLPDGTDDAQYLGWLDQALSSALRQFEPELLCYIAGADPYEEDQLGGLGLTIDGLKKRDEMVLRVARSRKIPVMITFAGGYAVHVQDTVTIHANTIISAKEICQTCNSN